MDKYALLHRLNPSHWPEWKDHIAPGRESEVWFETGKCRPSEITSGLPVFVLGTSPHGLLAAGETVSAAELKKDPLWHLAPVSEQARYKEPRFRVRVRLRSVNVPRSALLKNPEVSRLPNTARAATNWLRSHQHSALVQLVKAHGG